MIALKNIMVATDFGEAADAALIYGRAIAGRFGATLHVVHVTENVYVKLGSIEAAKAISPDPQRKVDEAARKQLDARLIDNDPRPLRVKPAIVASNAPVTAIVEYAKAANIDLIVMGTHGRGAVDHLMMGNVAERVVRTAPCPVLTVRHPEHEFVQPDTLVTGATP